MHPGEHSEQQQQQWVAEGKSYIVPRVLVVVNTGLGAGGVADGYGHSRARAGFSKTWLLAVVTVVLNSDSAPRGGCTTGADAGSSHVWRGRVVESGVHACRR